MPRMRSCTPEGVSIAILFSRHHRTRMPDGATLI
ncbi:hypothetical protein LTSEADE_4063, partial [Salmonella enterica subsp. enterica serovar Adelaide str. A4-669]